MEPKSASVGQIEWDDSVAWLPSQTAGLCTPDCSSPCFHAYFDDIDTHQLHLCPGSYLTDSGISSPHETNYDHIAGPIEAHYANFVRGSTCCYKEPHVFYKDWDEKNVCLGLELLWKYVGSSWLDCFSNEPCQPSNPDEWDEYGFCGMPMCRGHKLPDGWDDLEERYKEELKEAMENGITKEELDEWKAQIAIKIVEGDAEVAQGWNDEDWHYVDLEKVETCVHSMNDVDDQSEQYNTGW